MKLAAFVAALVLAGGAPLAAQEPPADEMAEARAIIAAMFPPQSRDAQMRDMMSAMMEQMKDGMGLADLTPDPSLNSLLDAYLTKLPDTLMPLVREHLPLMLEATATAYTNEFSLDELRELRRFSTTPVGAHYFSRTTALLSDPAVGAANARYFAALKEIQGTEVEKLKAQLMDYFEKHPEAAKNLSKGGPN